MLEWSLGQNWAQSMRYAWYGCSALPISSNVFTDASEGTAFGSADATTGPCVPSGYIIPKEGKSERRFCKPSALPSGVSIEVYVIEIAFRSACASRIAPIKIAVSPPSCWQKA